jgi:nitrate/TMAO reductase-like tetraheme cytochrome c subunit
MRALTIAAVLVAMAATTAQAETFPVIQNATVLKECGDCHMAFPPETLPKASWEKIIGNLADHFGENASLDPAATAEILAYHVKNASDVSTVRAATKWLAKGTFARITDAPRFHDKHGNCPPEVWSHEKVRSKSNCLACHPTMQKDGSTDANMKFLPANLKSQCGE